MSPPHPRQVPSPPGTRFPASTAPLRPKSPASPAPRAAHALVARKKFVISIPPILAPEIHAIRSTPLSAPSARPAGDSGDRSRSPASTLNNPVPGTPGTSRGLSPRSGDARTYSAPATVSTASRLSTKHRDFRVPTMTLRVWCSSSTRSHCRSRQLRSTASAS